MNSESLEIEKYAISLPITSEIRHAAEQFAVEQPTKDKARRVFLNTIAVAVVNNYLRMLDIQTDLARSDSWNPVMRLCKDTADLLIPGVGTLECRPVRNDATSCQIPLEVWELRFGYTVVRIDNALKEAQILGFTPQVTTEELSLKNLKPLEALLDRLHQLRESTVERSFVDLGRWFYDIFETGWQTVESIFRRESLNPSFGFRSTELSNELSELDREKLSREESGVTRAKSIDLGVKFGDRNVVLLVRLVPEANNKVGVTIQIHPPSNELYLPETLKLKILEDSDTLFMEAQARSQDNYIQLQFSGESQEIFTVEIILNGITFSEQFRI